MMKTPEEKADELIAGLKQHETNDRRKLEMLGGAAIALTSLAVAFTFLMILKVGGKSPTNIFMSLFVLIGAVALFGRGLKDLVIGKRRQ